MRDLTLAVKVGELYPVYMEDDGFPHHDILVSDEFYERYVKVMNDFADVQIQLEETLLDDEG